MNIYAIYKATNLINGKAYIGFDSKWPNRQQTHKSSSKCKLDNYKFHNALRKYGWLNFKWEILYQSYEREHTLKQIEPLLIKEHNTHFKQGYGYNMTFGGDGSFGYKHTQKSKQKMSNFQKGKILSNDHKLKISQNTKKAKRWKVITPNNDIIIIKGINQFCKDNNLHSACMSMVAQGKISQHKGFRCQIL